MKKKILALSLFATSVVFNSSASYALVMINEFLADPAGGLAGDANADGIRSSSEDEFIELLNPGTATENLSGGSLWDNSAIRHSFANATFLLPDERLVVFGGGNPANIPGKVAIASTGGLSLNNTSDQIFLKNAAGQVIDFISFGAEGNQDQSLTRFPEGAGPFRLHRDVSSSQLLFSPGRSVNPEPPHTALPSTPEPATFVLLAAGLAALPLAQKISMKKARIQ